MYLLVYIDDASIKLLTFVDKEDKDGVSMISLKSSRIKQIHGT